MDLKKYSSIVFDLDGTLVDSIGDIAFCMNKVLDRNNLPLHTKKDYRIFIGDGVDLLIARASGYKFKSSEALNLKKEFEIIYKENYNNELKSYPNVRETLEKLKRKNIRLFVLSNKPHKYMHNFIDDMFDVSLFDEIQGTPSAEYVKPNTFLLENIIKKYNLDLKEMLIVGDGTADLQLAKNMSIDSAWASWGYKSINEVKKIGFTFLLNEFSDLIS